MCLEVPAAESRPLICVLRLLIFKLLARFVLYILVLAYVIDLSDDARHEHLLGEEID